MPALHYAIQEHRHETTKLLLQYNADPFIFSKWGDDALQTSCLKVYMYCRVIIYVARIKLLEKVLKYIFNFQLQGAGEIFNHLVDNIAYSPERVASAYELIGMSN